MLQEELSALSGTHWQQFNHFSADVDSFKKETQRFFIAKMAAEETYRTFTLKDIAAIPRFTERAYYDYHWSHVTQAFLVYLTIILLLVAIGYSRLLTTKK
jgi:ABC-2 type transport system permease protein